MTLPEVVAAVVSIARQRDIVFTAADIARVWPRIIQAFKVPDEETVRAAMVAGVEQGDLEWYWSTPPLPDGEPRVVLSARHRFGLAT